MITLCTHTTVVKFCQNILEKQKRGYVLLSHTKGGTLAEFLVLTKPH